MWDPDSALSTETGHYFIKLPNKLTSQSICNTFIKRRIAFCFRDELSILSSGKDGARSEYV